MDITKTRSKRRNTLFPNALLLKKFAAQERDEEDDEDVELPDFLQEEEQEGAKEEEGSKKPKITPNKRSSSMSSQSSDETKDPAIHFANKHLPGKVPSNVPFGFSLNQPQQPVKPKSSKKVHPKSPKTKKTQPKKPKAIVPKPPSASKETSSSTTEDFSRTVDIADALRNVENRIQINLNNIRQKDEVRLSIRDIHCEIKSRLGNTQSKSEQTDYSIVTESYIQKLKNEINMSRAQPDVDGSNTDVRELKCEINQYKKLLKCGCTPVDSANFVSASTSPVVLKVQSTSACQAPCKKPQETGKIS